MDDHTNELSRRNILVVYYSFTGKTLELAREVAKGASEVAGCDVTIKRIPELIPSAVFEKNPTLREIRDKQVAEFPEATVDDLKQADAIAFGSPVHFGSFASQFKQLIDQFSPIWLKGEMVNKPAAVFCTAGSVHAGEEATLLSMIIPLLNLGMIPVGIPYPIQGEGAEFDSGSPYGAVWTTGHKGEKPITEGHRKVARILGRRLAVTARLLGCGCEHCALCQDLTTSPHE